MKVDYIKTIPIGSVTITDSFLSKYTGMVEDKIIPYQWEMLNDDEKSGIIHDFRVAAGEIVGKHLGYVFQDEGLPKWLESVSYSLMHHRNSQIEEWADYAIDLIAKAQREDGYVLTYFLIEHPDKAFKNLLESHELVCLGNILEAGIAYYHATGKRKLLDVAIKLANFLCDYFAENGENAMLVPGHPGMEFCLVKLYRETHDEKYLALAKHFLDVRGLDPEVLEKQHDKEWKLPNIFPTWYSFANHTYMQIHKPVRQQTTAEGHTVRATYLYSGMADVYMETGDETLLKACEMIYKDLVGRRMYITGGVGSSECGERFTSDYDLPNDTVYAESCGSVGLAFFCSRMFQCTGDAKYIDTMERAIYNTVAGSISLDGEHYFYVNPLEVWPEASKLNPTRRHVKSVRQGWYQVACCPQNTLRILSGFDQYIYYVKNRTIYVGLFVDGKAKLPVDGGEVGLDVTTKYPFDGKVEIKVNTTGKYAFALRKPSFSGNPQIRVNGKAVSFSVEKGFLTIECDWQIGDTITYSFDMPSVLVSANPYVRQDAYKVALVKGPIVYCLEQVDNGENLSAVSVCANAEIKEVFDDTLFGGTLTLTLPGKKLVHDDWGEDELYRNLPLKTEDITLKAVPYCLWNNRGEGEMLIWMHVQP